VAISTVGTHPTSTYDLGRRRDVELDQVAMGGDKPSQTNYLRNWSAIRVGTICDDVTINFLNSAESSISAVQVLELCPSMSGLIAVASASEGHWA
jgi:hypothetical protein